MSVEIEQVHGFSYVVVLSLGNASLMGSSQTKRIDHSTLMSLIMGKISLIFNKKLLIRDSKQTVEIVKIRMKVEKEPAVKMGRKSECKSCYKNIVQPVQSYPPQSFSSFFSYSVQIEPLEVGRAAIITTREVKQVPQSHSQRVVTSSLLALRPCVLLGDREPAACRRRVSHGNCRVVARYH